VVKMAELSGNTSQSLTYCNRSMFRLWPLACEAFNGLAGQRESSPER